MSESHSNDHRSDDTVVTAPPPSDPVDDYGDEIDEIPPRRRLLTAPVATLAALLLVGAGFLGGVLVQKHYGGSGSGSRGGANLASIRAAFTGAGGGGATGAGNATGGGATGGFRGGGGGGGGFGARGGGATSGEVKVIDGSTLYVTDASGDTVEVKTSTATKVTKPASASVKAIYPGDTITVRGSSGSSGAIQATAISLGSSSSGDGGSSSTTP
jgi:hypothetical protein